MSIRSKGSRCGPDKRPARSASATLIGISANSANPQPFPTFSDFFLNCDIYGRYPGCELVPYINGNGDQRAFSVLKGPMATQTMRGMSTHGHMHWRGDRSTGYFGTDEGRHLYNLLIINNFL